LLFALLEKYCYGDEMREIEWDGAYGVYGTE